MLTIEIVAAVFGAISVYFYIVRKHWSWPVGLVQVILYIAVFASAKLYADMLLHIVYAGLQVYGWWAWWQTPLPHSLDRQTAALPATERLVVRTLPLPYAAGSIAVAIILTALFSAALMSWTDAAAPVADSLIAAASLVAQVLLAQRYLENWIYWIFVDIVGIGLFSYKELYPTAVLYGLFLVMAVIGWLTWRRVFRQQPLPLRPFAQSELSSRELPSQELPERPE